MFKRPRDIGNTAGNFLKALTVEIYLTAAMMCDAATEAMSFIRKLDTEDLDNAELSSFIEQFLDHIYFMFYERGVLTIKGHTTFIIDWLENRTTHFVVDGKGMSIGGSKIKDSLINKVLERMHGWVQLARACCEAEFPSFSVLNAFSVFALPRAKPKAAFDLFKQPDLIKKLKRLGITFGKSDLLAKYKEFWNYAFIAYKAASFMISYWEAWRQGIANASGRTHNGADLLSVIVRGQVWSSATSKVEQSFSEIQDLLTDKRLHADCLSEDMGINLKLMHYEESALEQLLADAQKIWAECFPEKITRVHHTSRIDKGIIRGVTWPCTRNPF